MPWRHLAEDELGDRRVVDVHPGRRVVEHAEPVVTQLVGAGVDQVELEVVTGEDAGELETDVADPEDRDRRHHRERFEQDLHLAAAALLAVLGRRLVVEGQRDLLGRGRAPRRASRGPW